METATVAERRIGIRDYFEILFEIIRSPARYYQKVANETGSRNALFFLMISAVFYCSVSMAYFFENSLAMGVVMMINAVVMPVFSAAITFILLSMTGLGRVSYGRVFNIYGYASGAVMVVSWIPGLAIVMEPIRAALVCVGLVKMTGVGKIKSIFIVVLTALLLLLFFWTAAPLVFELQQLLN